MATLRQREANRRNSLLSTGPRSPDAASAANGRTHGLSASKWLRDDERERLAERTAELEDELMPDNAAQRAVVAEIAAAVVRIESCDMDEENWRFHRAQRAEYYWDEDRQAEAEALMAKLDRNPSLYVRKLRQTLHGAQRLRRAFAALAALVAGGAAGEGEPARPLDAVSRERGFDLLGLEPEERQGATPLDLPGGRSGDDAALAAHQAALFAEQLADLDRLTSERYIELDQKMRLEAELGNFPGIDDQTRLIRRYRSEAQRRRDLGLKELRRLQDEADELDDDAWDSEFYRSRAATLLRSSPHPPASAPAPVKTEESRPVPQTQARPETATKPVQAEAATDANPVSAGAETPTNPQAGDSSPRPGQPDGSHGVRVGPRPQPPAADGYAQKAAHRTLH
jgi:hypothetical protein